MYYLLMLVVCLCDVCIVVSRVDFLILYLLMFVAQLLPFRNVPFDCEEEDIADLFSQFGEIVYCKQVINQDTGVPKGM